MWVIIRIICSFSINGSFICTGFISCIACLSKEQLFLDIPCPQFDSTTLIEGTFRQEFAEFYLTCLKQLTDYRVRMRSNNLSIAW